MKEKTNKKGITRRLFSVVIALAMVLSLMPLNSIIVYAADSHTIAITSVANGSVTASSSSVEAGTTVTLTANPDSGYHLDSLSGTFSGSETLSNSGATVEGTYSTLASNSRATAGWKMQSQTNTITVSAKGEGNKISKIKFNRNNKGADWVPGKLGTDCEATISSDGNTVWVVLAEPQQTVTLSTTATNARTGCTLNSATVYGEFILNIDTSTLTFTMPDSDITITPSFVIDHVHTNKSQPKTGVMDTLPMWFGVMAVSAAAYVLTSKKRFF